MSETYCGKNCEECIYKENQEAAKKAQFLGKWLWLLFWLVIPSTLASILTQENVVSWFPAVKVPGEILNVCCTIAYSLILLKVSSENMNYRTAGISKLLAIACSTVAGLINGYGLKMLLLLPGLIIAMVSAYFEYTAHGDEVSGYDSETSGKWYRIWKWHLRTMIGMFGGIALMLLIPILGLVVYIASTIGQAVVAIWQLVCLYQTARVFRKWKAEEIAT